MTNKKNNDKDKDMFTCKVKDKINQFSNLKIADKIFSSVLMILTAFLAFVDDPTMLHLYFK